MDNFVRVKAVNSENLKPVQGRVDGFTSVLKVLVKLWTTCQKKKLKRSDGNNLEVVRKNVIPNVIPSPRLGRRPIRHQESDIACQPCSIFASREKPEQFCQFEYPNEPVGLDEEC